MHGCKRSAASFVCFVINSLCHWQGLPRRGSAAVEVACPAVALCEGWEESLHILFAHLSFRAKSRNLWING